MEDNELKLTGYLRDYLEHNRLIGHTQFYLKGFLTQNPHLIKYVENMDYPYFEDLINRDDTILFVVNLEQFDYKTLVARKLIDIPRMIIGAFNRHNNKLVRDNERIENLREIIGYYFEAFNAAKSDVIKLVKADPKEEHIKPIIRERGNNANKALLMELLLDKKRWI